jgi:hypothetical protein
VSTALSLAKLLVVDKHSSLFCWVVSNKEKKFDNVISRRIITLVYRWWNNELVDLQLPGVNCIELFYSSLRTNKLKRFSQTCLSGLV